ncbi:uracil-DNA glycosylase-like protein [Xylaria grammica]|nr:uracil-DNA glycosylase-like protein [Xylaria grammica]
MSEEIGEHDAAETQSSVSKEPSFHGRLQLKDFAFDGSTTHTPRGIRHSPRLRSLQATATPSESASPPAQKRKSESRSRSSKTNSKGDGRDDDGKSPSPRKKRNRESSSYAAPSTYAHLSPLIDVITPNLLILFIGLNPGVQTARAGHAYAHPSNLFWKLLYSSGITPVPCKPEEDRTLPERFSLGNTNIVSRPSRNGAELSKAEMDAGVAILEEKCRRWRPEAVCVVGKSIWESIFRVWNRRNLAKGEFQYGWQTERMGAVPPADDSASARVGVDASKELARTEALMDGASRSHDGDSDNEESERDAREDERREKVEDGPWEGSRIFVATSTSGLAASLRPEEKERIWKILGDWCVQRRKERAEKKK